MYKIMARKGNPNRRTTNQLIRQWENGIHGTHSSLAFCLNSLSSFSTSASSKRSVLPGGSLPFCWRRQIARHKDHLFTLAILSYLHQELNQTKNFLFPQLQSYTPHKEFCPHQICSILSGILLNELVDKINKLGRNFLFFQWCPQNTSIQTPQLILFQRRTNLCGTREFLLQVLQITVN